MSRPRTTSPLDTDTLQGIEKVVNGGLGDLTLKELLGHLLGTVARSERDIHLREHQDDAGNGTYARELAVGSLPLDINVPRTRAGTFRPTILPPPYQRSYPGATQDLLESLLAGARSVNAAKASLKQLGLSVPDAELDTIAKEYVDEIDLRNKGPLPSDLLALFFDGKYVEVREGDCLKPACIYTVVGLLRTGQKRVLSCQVYTAKENLEDWKKVLNNLFARGLRHVLIVVHDDFSGLLTLTKKLFPTSDIQLCIVHMQRNAKYHLPKEAVGSFLNQLATIKASWDSTKAKADFIALCDAFQDKDPSFIKHIRKNADQYLAFLAYPQPIRRTLSTTNVVEAVNGVSAHAELQ